MKLTDIPKLMPVPFGVNGNRSELLPVSPAGDGSASYADGFPPITMLLKSAGGLPPKGENMNQILFELASGIRWINTGAGYAFNKAFCDAIGGYPKGAKLTSNDGKKIYISTKNDNATDFNVTAGTDWVTLTDFLGVDGKLTKNENGADIPDKPKFIENLGLKEVFQPKGNYAPTGNYAYKGDSYTKAESDNNYQPKGSYQAAGYSYSKAESDNKYQPKGQAVGANTANKAIAGWWECGSTGIMHQWNTQTWNAGQSLDFKFPIAFPNACIAIIVTDSEGYQSMGTKNRSRTGFTLTGNQSALAFSYFAIGY